MIIFLLFPILSSAAIIQDDVSVTEKNSFSFSSVCSKMVKHESPLIDVVSGSELDCMSKKISVADFCDKEMIQDPYYLRAYINEAKKEVTCLSGKKVLFKYLCTNRADALCNSDVKISCAEIKSKLAKRLEAVHTSFTNNPKGIKQLNCYFEASNNEP